MGWLFQEFIFQLFDIPWKSELLGQLGDTFGALNALFSAFAFVAVLYTLKHQRDDLARQQLQIDDAALDQHLQRFERTFYELLRLLREARDEVEYRYSENYEGGSRQRESDYGTQVNGAQAFKRAQFELKYWVETHLVHKETISGQEVAEIYTKFVHSRYESSFAPYYRLLYTILLRVKSDQKLKPAEKRFYGNLLRSQLTSHEVALCCYNGLASYSGSFKTLIEAFRLPKYLPEEFGRSLLKMHYPESAFAGRD
ncbi:putative phage abortive infection protein [Sinorhizobium meliloti]|uniref:putative phage abortive infection protein n=1 Tax=Rhizobium meliloti TaxID=382 RepID=UPI0013E2E554|nr:putative phage abortive infection protein [Sinorhizobium meliloti]